MKYLGLLGPTLVLMLFRCNSDIKSNASTKINPVIKSEGSTKHNSETIKLPDDNKDKDDIQTLIRQTLNWGDSKSSINLLPVLSKDSICIGFDFDKQNQNLEKLRQSGFFANEFIDNYNQIIQTLDKKIKNKEFEPWNVYELPTFNFANDVDPWTLCQDVPYDKPNPLDFVEVGIINLDNKKGELYWKWGNLYSNADSSWKNFSYKFRVEKVDSKWEISYLQGFDYKESIK